MRSFAPLAARGSHRAIKRLHVEVGATCTVTSASLPVTRVARGGGAGALTKSLQWGDSP